eukprot:Partr_v1_DN26763_c0_g1_i4_m8766 putative wiskott-Aldrich
MKDTRKNNSFFFRFVHMQTGSVVWEQEVFRDFKYYQEKPFFHSFHTDLCTAGLSFADENEALAFYTKVQGRDNLRVQSRASPSTSVESPARNNAPSSSAGFFGSGSGVSNTSATTASASGGGKKKKREKGKFDKTSIGAPSNFRHLTHVGYDPEKGFETSNVPPEWKRVFEKAGVTDDQLKDAQTAKFIIDFMQQNYEPDTLGAPPVVAAAPAPPPVVVESSSTVVPRRAAPPPPPSRGGAAPPLPSRAADPPPPAKRVVAPPAPPSDSIAPPVTSGVGPPPPPPAPAAIPAPAPPSVSKSSAAPKKKGGADDGRGDLLASIRNREAVKLKPAGSSAPAGSGAAGPGKKAPVAVRPPPTGVAKPGASSQGGVAPPTPARPVAAPVGGGVGAADPSDLMASIRQAGLRSLKPANEREVPVKETAAVPTGDIAGALRAALMKRQEVTRGDDDSEEEESGEDEW